MTKKQQKFLEQVRNGTEPLKAYREVFRVEGRSDADVLRRARAIMDSEAGHLFLGVHDIRKAVQGGRLEQECGGRMPDIKALDAGKWGSEESGLVFGLPPNEMLVKIRELEQVMEAAKGYDFPSFVPRGNRKKPPLSEQEVVAGLRDLKDKCLGLKPVIDVKGAVFNPSGANRALELLGRYLGMFDKKEEPGEDPFQKLDRILQEIDRAAEEDHQ